MTRPARAVSEVYTARPPPWPGYTRFQLMYSRQRLAAEAGISRRYGGIHFESGDLASRAMGEAIGRQVWQKVQHLVGGSVRRRP